MCCGPSLSTILVKRTQNMLDYADEIKARPARTWFQTERQKQELKKKVAQMTAEGREDVEDDEVREGTCCVGATVLHR